jgi:hypothetical protein
MRDMDDNKKALRREDSQKREGRPMHSAKDFMGKIGPLAG